MTPKGKKVLTVADVGRDSVVALLARFGLTLIVQDDARAITGSFWGECEAGVVGLSVYVRRDTPVHSLLHETCHTICMSGARREQLDRDAGGDDIEESAVCYLQIVLADQLEGVGRKRLMQDMDAWGYSFRLGETASWFRADAEDAQTWLVDHDLLQSSGEPAFRLRK